MKRAQFVRHGSPSLRPPSEAEVLGTHAAQDPDGSGRRGVSQGLDALPDRIWHDDILARLGPRSLACFGSVSRGSRRLVEHPECWLSHRMTLGAAPASADEAVRTVRGTSALLPSEATLAVLAVAVTIGTMWQSGGVTENHPADPKVELATASIWTRVACMAPVALVGIWIGSDAWRSWRQGGQDAARLVTERAAPFERFAVVKAVRHQLDRALRRDDLPTAARALRLCPALALDYGELRQPLYRAAADGARALASQHRGDPLMVKAWVQVAHRIEALRAAAIAAMSE